MGELETMPSLVLKASNIKILKQCGISRRFSKYIQVPNSSGMLTNINNHDLFECIINFFFFFWNVSLTFIQSSRLRWVISTFREYLYFHAQCLPFRLYHSLATAPPSLFPCVPRVPMFFTVAMTIFLCFPRPQYVSLWSLKSNLTGLNFLYFSTPP